MVAPRQRAIILNRVCPQARAFLNRTSGLNSVHANAYIRLINRLVAAGVWPLLDVLNIYATQNQVTALLNLVSASFASTITGSVTFAADGGFTGTASVGNYIDTNFTPSTNGINYQLNSASQGFYNRTSRTTAQAYADMGNCITGGTTGFDFLTTNYTGNISHISISSTASINTASANSMGMWVNSRTAVTAVAQYKNTIQTQSGATSTAGGGLSDQTYLVLARRNVTGNLDNSADQCGAMFLAGGLSAYQAAIISDEINSFMRVIGANVY